MGRSNDVKGRKGEGRRVQEVPRLLPNPQGAGRKREILSSLLFHQLCRSLREKGEEQRAIGTGQERREGFGAERNQAREMRDPQIEGWVAVSAPNSVR